MLARPIALSFVLVAAILAVTLVVIGVIAGSGPSRASAGAPAVPCPPVVSGTGFSDVFVGIFEPKERIEYARGLGGDPGVSEEKIAVEAAVHDVVDSQVPGTQKPSDINVCLTMTPLGTQPCSGRFRLVKAETPEKMVFSSLIFGKNGDQVMPTQQVVQGTLSSVGPTASAGDTLQLFWQLKNVLPGEKVEVEPYMLHDCTPPPHPSCPQDKQLGCRTFSFVYDLVVNPDGEQDLWNSENVDVQQTTVFVTHACPCTASWELWSRRAAVEIGA